MRRWRGPSLLVALEGEGNANAFLSHRGQLTKCALEHIRKASPLEKIAADSWEAAIQDVIGSVPIPEDEQVLDDDEVQPEKFTGEMDEPETPFPSGVTQSLTAAPPLNSAEIAAASMPANATISRRSSLVALPTPPTSVAHETPPVAEVANPEPAVPVPEPPVLPATSTSRLGRYPTPRGLVTTMTRARSVDAAFASCFTTCGS